MTIAEKVRQLTGYIHLNDVAALLGSHPQTLYKACRKGKIPHVRVGGRIKFDPATLADWVERRQVG